MLKPNTARPDAGHSIRTVCLSVLLASSLVLPLCLQAKSVEDARQLIRLKNFAGATRVLDELARGGDAEAQYMLAVMYRNGHGVDRDLKQAFNWFLKAAQNKHARAQYETGMCYLNALGIQQDTAQARVWLGKAAQADYAQAREQLALLKAEPEVHDSAQDNFQHAQHAVATGDQRALDALIDHIQINQQDKLGNSLLHTASQYNNVSAAKRLLGKGASRTLRNQNANTPLAVAINQNYADMIRLLMDKSQINDRLEGGATPAILAARQGNDDLIRQLSKLGADLALRDQSGLNALDYAEKRNQGATRNLLLSLGVKPTRQTENLAATLPAERTDFYKGWTDLMIAAWKGLEQQCRERLNKDDVNAQDPQGYTALMRAAMKNHDKIVVLLLQQKAAGDTKNRQGETALYLAAAEGHAAVVTSLLVHKVNANSAARNGATPLIMAVRNAHADVVNALLQYGADVNAQQDNGMTALHWAVTNKQDKIAAALLRQGAKFDAYDNQGRTALHLAAMQNQSDTLDKMIAAGANVNQQDKTGYTLLSYVAEYGSAPAVASLISRGADANRASRSGNNTPLMLAADKGAVDTVKVLMASTTDIDHKNNHGNTALILAAKSGHVDIVRALLEKGARANIRNQNKNTALDVAKLENRKDVVAVLEQHQSASESWLDLIR